MSQSLKTTRSENDEQVYKSKTAADMFTEKNCAGKTEKHFATDYYSVPLRPQLFKVVNHDFQKISNMAFASLKSGIIFKCLMESCDFKTDNDRAFETHLRSHLNDGGVCEDSSFCYTCNSKINAENIIGELQHIRIHARKIAPVIEIKLNDDELGKEYLIEEKLSERVQVVEEKTTEEILPIVLPHVVSNEKQITEKAPNISANFGFTPMVSIKKEINSLEMMEFHLQQAFQAVKDPGMSDATDLAPTLEATFEDISVVKNKIEKRKDFTTKGDDSANKNVCTSVASSESKQLPSSSPQEKRNKTKEKLKSTRAELITEKDKASLDPRVLENSRSVDVKRLNSNKSQLEGTSSSFGNKVFAKSSYIRTSSLNHRSECDAERNDEKCVLKRSSSCFDKLPDKKNVKKARIENIEKSTETAQSEPKLEPVRNLSEQISSTNHMTPDNAKLIAEATNSDDVMSTIKFSGPNVHNTVESKEFYDDTQVHTDQTSVKVYDTELMPWAKHSRHRNFKDKHHFDYMKTKEALIGLYKCMDADCSFTGSCFNDFASHLRMHDMQRNETSFFQLCSYCQFHNTNIGVLCNHIKTLHSYDKYQCSHCFFRSPELETVQEHLILHHNEAKAIIYECPYAWVRKPMNIKNREMLMCKRNVSPVQHRKLRCHKHNDLKNRMQHNHNRYFDDLESKKQNDDRRTYQCLYCDFETSVIEYISRHMVFHPSESRSCYNRSSLRIMTINLKLPVKVEKFSIKGSVLIIKN